MNLMGNQVFKSSITSHITSKNAEKQFMFSINSITINFFFFYETCMITGKSYQSYMTLYDYRGKCNSETHHFVDSRVFF